MATQLTRLIPTAVGIVDKGANGLPFFIVKSAEGIVPAKSDNGDQTMDVEKISKAAGVTPEQLKAVVGTLAATNKDATVGAVAAKIAAPVSTPDELSPVLKAQQDEIVKLQKALDGERDIRVTGELVAVCKSKYPHVPVKPDDYAKRMKALGGTESEQGKAYDAELAATESLLAKSALFTETGSSLSGGMATTGAWGELIQKAAEIRKADPTMTEEVAIDRAALAYPEIARRASTERV